jgi:hypothetical protein
MSLAAGACALSSGQVSCLFERKPSTLGPLTRSELPLLEYASGHSLGFIPWSIMTVEGNEP